MGRRIIWIQYACIICSMASLSSSNLRVASVPTSDRGSDIVGRFVDAEPTLYVYVYFCKFPYILKILLPSTGPRDGIIRWAKSNDPYRSRTPDQPCSLFCAIHPVYSLMPLIPLSFFRKTQNRENGNYLSPCHYINARNMRTCTCVIAKHEP